MFYVTMYQLRFINCVLHDVYIRFLENTLNLKPFTSKRDLCGRFSWNAARYKTVKIDLCTDH